MQQGLRLDTRWSPGYPVRRARARDKAGRGTHDHVRGIPSSREMFAVLGEVFSATATGRHCRPVTTRNALPRQAPLRRLADKLSPRPPDCRPRTCHIRSARTVDRDPRRRRGYRRHPRPGSTSSQAAGMRPARLGCDDLHAQRRHGLARGRLEWLEDPYEIGAGLEVTQVGHLLGLGNAAARGVEQIQQVSRPASDVDEQTAFACHGRGRRTVQFVRGSSKRSRNVARVLPSARNCLSASVRSSRASPPTACRGSAGRPRWPPSRQRPPGRHAPSPSAPTNCTFTGTANGPWSFTRQVPFAVPSVAHQSRVASLTRPKRGGCPPA